MDVQTETLVSALGKGVGQRGTVRTPVLVHPFFMVAEWCPNHIRPMCPKKGHTMKTIKSIVNENTTLGELLSILSVGEKPHETPTPRNLRETAGKPVAIAEGCTVYANGFCVYDNGSGRTVVWLPSCISFTYHFDPLRDSEKEEINETVELPEGLLETLPWPIAVTLVGDHRIEKNMTNRTGSRTGTSDYNSDDNGDKYRDSEDAVERSYQKEYIWTDERFGGNPEDVFIREETQREMLQLMTEKQREVFILYYRDGYNQQEIADLLNIDQTSIRDRLSGALEKIKKVYK